MTAINLKYRRLSDGEQRMQPCRCTRLQEFLLGNISRFESNTFIRIARCFIKLFLHGELYIDQDKV
jgi:hypothetical protein